MVRGNSVSLQTNGAGYKLSDTAGIIKPQIVLGSAVENEVDDLTCAALSYVLDLKAALKEGINNSSVRLSAKCLNNNGSKFLILAGYGNYNDADGRRPRYGRYPFDE